MVPEDEGVVGGGVGVGALHVGLQNEERVAGGDVPVEDLVVDVGVDVVPREMTRLLQRPFHRSILIQITKINSSIHQFINSSIHQIIHQFINSSIHQIIHPTNSY